jgi:hypothetical protein
MENKIMQLLMEKGYVPLNEQLYAMASDFVQQQLYGVYAAGINVICIPQFSGIPKMGSLIVGDMVYKVVK